MSEAAVAEQTEIIPAAEAETPAPESTETGGLETEAASSPPAPVDEPVDYKPEDSEEWKATFGDTPATPAPKTDSHLPGKSLDDLAIEEHQKRAGRFSSIMQLAELQEMQPFLRDELGLEPADANKAWQKLRPLLADMYGLAESHNLAVTDQLLRSVLTPEEVKEYESRSYVAKDDKDRILPLESRKQAIQAVLALRDKKWQERVANGELVEKDKAEDKAKQAFIKGGDAREKWLKDNDRLKGASSGSTGVRGESATHRFNSEHDLNVAYNRGDVSHDVYKAEHIRLTGREP